MIETIIGINNTIETHLEEVMEYMKNNGVATLRAIRVDTLILVIEGSHRLEAANRLGMTINLEIMNKSDIVDLETLDFDIDADGELTYRDLIEFIGNGNEYQYNEEMHNLIFE